MKLLIKIKRVKLGLGCVRSRKGESSDNSSCKIEEIEDEASSVPSIKKAQCKIK